MTFYLTIHVNFSFFPFKIIYIFYFITYQVLKVKYIQIRCRFCVFSCFIKYLTQENLQNIIILYIILRTYFLFKNKNIYFYYKYQNVWSYNVSLINYSAKYERLNLFICLFLLPYNDFIVYLVGLTKVVLHNSYTNINTIISALNALNYVCLP